MSTTVNRNELEILVKSVIECAKGADADASIGRPDIKPLRIPLALHGMHGIGKTESVAQVAEKMGYNFTALYLSTQDVSDLLGIPYKDEETGATRFAQPDWLRDSLEDDRPCIFFLDEMNRAEPYVLQTMLPFVLDGSLHTHKIRPQDIVIAAMNPETAEYNVESIDDQALLSRFCHAYFEPDASEWKTYSTSIGVHPAIMAVVETNESIIQKGVSVHDEQRIKATPDRRSLTKLGLALQILPKDTVERIGFKLCAGMVGDDTASLVIAAYNTVDHITTKNIFDGSIFKRKDINFDADLDRINTLMDQLVVDIVEGEGKYWDYDSKTERPKYKLNKKQMDNLRKFIEKSPQDAQFSFVRSIKMKVQETIEDKSKGMRTIMGLLQEIDKDMITRAVPETTK
jgi:hypothetical protein